MEAQLTSDEKAFLAQHDLCCDDFYDGRYQSKDERHDNAKNAGKELVLTSVYCRNGGHRLRTRSGHCIQCHPDKIAYIKRFVSSGILYIAHPLEENIYKIGIVQNNKNDYQLTLDNRWGSLNGDGGYGGYKCWRIEQWAFIDARAGEIEKRIHQVLAPHILKRIYNHAGKVQQTNELFECSYGMVLQAIYQVFPEIDLHAFVHKQQCI